MDLTRVIATHRQALLAVLSEIAALLDVALTGTAKCWPHEIQAQARRLLRPAESALRRLIILMARDVVVKLPPAKPMPKGLVITASRTSIPRFKLYDTRKRYRAPDAQPNQINSGPRIRFIGIPSPLIPAAFTQKPKPNRAAGLRRRFAALKQAYETLPQQALRLARWRARRALKVNPKFTSPLRPGPPPGHQRKPRFKIDELLDALHGLAFDALYANSS